VKTPIQSAHHQRGVMLLEALISILIFSIGILAIIGLQVNSIKLANDSKYRSDANLLATQMVGAMWMAQSSPTFTTDYSTGGAQYLTWAAKVASSIPTTGVSAPTVAISSVSVAIAGASPVLSSTAQVDIYWIVPGESANGASAHHYQTFTQINNN
jgi:type IV pilus assembly protein PilV